MRNITKITVERPERYGNYIGTRKTPFTGTQLNARVEKSVLVIENEGDVVALFNDWLGLTVDERSDCE